MARLAVSFIAFLFLTIALFQLLIFCLFIVLSSISADGPTHCYWTPCKYTTSAFGKCPIPYYRAPGHKYCIWPLLADRHYCCKND